MAIEDLVHELRHGGTIEGRSTSLPTGNGPRRATESKGTQLPTEPVDVVLPGEDGRNYQEMRWGLVPYWWSKPFKELRLATFNARVETVESKPFFRDAFKQRRCLMPVSGYYEWQATPDGKQPHHFTARDGSPVLTVAALWDEWKDRANPDKPLRSCTMIITQPNDFVAEVHDRMPALLRPDQFEGWLSGKMGATDLRPVDNDYLQRVPVSKRVNSSRADDSDATLANPM